MYPKNTGVVYFTTALIVEISLQTCTVHWLKCETQHINFVFILVPGPTLFAFLLKDFFLRTKVLINFCFLLSAGEFAACMHSAGASVLCLMCVLNN